MGGWVDGWVDTALETPRDLGVSSPNTKVTTCLFDLGGWVGGWVGGRTDRECYSRVSHAPGAKQLHGQVGKERGGVDGTGRGGDEDGGKDARDVPFENFEGGVVAFFLGEFLDLGSGWVGGWVG